MVPSLRNQKLELTDQRRQVELINQINRAHAKRMGQHPELETAIRSLETAFRMQSEAMETLDITQEREQIRERYGKGSFARGCLIASRLVERGVRIVQIYFGPGQPWDHHDDIMEHRRLEWISMRVSLPSSWNRRIRVGAGDTFRLIERSTAHL